MLRRKALGAAALAAACLTIGAGAGLALAPGSNLYINGALASSRVFAHNGTACVPVADVAKALGMTVTTKADGYAIAPAGGALQVNGLNGKIGDKLTNGQLVLTVVKAIRQDRYNRQFGTGDISPGNESEDMVVVFFRIKNAMNKQVEMNLAGGSLTALTDPDEHAYKASDQDSNSPYPKLLPGSAVDFALAFRVPKSEKMGDMVYQIDAFDNTIKKSVFRISLASANS